MSSTSSISHLLTASQLDRNLISGVLKFSKCSFSRIAAKLSLMAGERHGYHICELPLTCTVQMSLRSVWQRLFTSQNLNYMRHGSQWNALKCNVEKRLVLSLLLFEVGRSIDVLNYQFVSWWRCFDGCSKYMKKVKVEVLLIIYYVCHTMYVNCDLSNPTITALRLSGTPYLVTLERH